MGILDRRQLMLTDTSIRLNISCTHSCSEKDNDLPTIKDLLSSVVKPQAWQQTGSSDRRVTGGSEGDLEDAAKNNGNNVASPGLSYGYT